MRFLKFLIINLLFFACNNVENKFEISNNYVLEIDSFFKSKMLERKSNYLQLVAIHRLKKGLNSFGKDKSNDLSLTIESLPGIIGVFEITDDSITFNAHKNIMINTETEYSVGKILLPLDKNGNSEKLFHNELSWRIITRSKQHYLRVWYNKNPAISTFSGFDKYKLNNDFIYNAYFTFYNKEKSQIVKSKIDGQRLTNFIGNVSFNYKNISYTLDVGHDGFIMVGDETNTTSTYGGGRYVYISLPKEDGNIILDFNKLYNPPCSFSIFTTCLYPPGQNQLPFSILAGEKRTLIK